MNQISSKAQEATSEPIPTAQNAVAVSISFTSQTKVLAEEPRDEREREEDAGHDREPTNDVVLLRGDLVLADVDQRQVRLERRRELVALAEQLLVDPAHVVMEVAEVAEQAAVDRRRRGLVRARRGAAAADGRRGRSP